MRRRQLVEDIARAIAERDLIPRQPFESCSQSQRKHYREIARVALVALETSTSIHFIDRSGISNAKS